MYEYEHMKYILKQEIIYTDIGKKIKAKHLLLQKEVYVRKST